MEFLSEFHLMRPQWLWCLLPAMLLALLLWRLRGRSGSWSDVISPSLLPYLVTEQTASSGPKLLPLLLLGWILAAVAAAGPSWQQLPQPIHQKQDALILVLDLSYSMKAADLAPSRMERARQKLLDLLAQRVEGQTGLIAYAGDSHIVTPLTDDNPTIANLLPALSPDMMPLLGSAPDQAISQALELLQSAGIRRGRILLVTDGVNAKSAARFEEILKGSAVELAILGIGTPEGAPIPLPSGGFLKDQQGAIVIPKLDDAALYALAKAHGGRYQRLQINNTDLDTLLAESALPSEEQTLALDRTADAWEDQGYLFVLLLLPLALALFRRGWLLCLLPLLFVATPQPAVAGVWDDLWLTPNQQGQQLLQQGDPAAASQLFDDPNWAGTAAYANDDFETAADKFSNSATADSWYNRGNALAKAGQLDEAIEAYKESLVQNPQASDAADNLALLEQLKDQQQEQQQEDDQQQDEDSEEQDQQGEQGDQGESGDQSESADGDPSESDSESQQQPPQDDEQSSQDQEAAPESDEQSSDEEDAEPEQAEPEDSSQEQSTAQAETGEATDEDLERDQAMQQWLRRIPDDPSGLLREKFRYESRQQQGNRREDETYW